MTTPLRSRGRAFDGSDVPRPVNRIAIRATSASGRVLPIDVDLSTRRRATHAPRSIRKRLPDVGQSDDISLGDTGPKYTRPLGGVAYGCMTAIVCRTAHGTTPGRQSERSWP